jgi:hypothetical protein
MATRRHLGTTPGCVADNNSPSPILLASPARLGSNSHRRSRPDLIYTAQAKCQFKLNIFTTSIYFRRHALHVFVYSSDPLLDMLGGLALPTRRSLDLRVQIFYLVLCSPPTRHSRGLGHANLRVARPVGPSSSVCSCFNCLTLVMSIR